MNPNATNHPISYFRKYHDDRQLDLSPVFQRKPVWNDAQASYLLDSILSDLPIPEIYVRSIIDDEGTTVLEVVDGQQRLRSIIRFFSNDLKLAGPDVTPTWAGARWDTLSSDQKERFWSYKLVVRELEGASDVEVRDMFRRLNANQSNLNAQELLHSQYHGEFIGVVEELANDSWWLDNKIVTPAQVRRMIDVEFMAELLVGIMAGPLDKKKGLEDYFNDFDEDFPDKDRWIKIFKRTRDLSKELVGGDLSGWTSKTEFYSLFLAVARCVVEQEVPSGERLSSVADRLSSFRTQVNRAKRRDSKERFDEQVTKYVRATTLASTDRGRRLDRINTIYALISDGAA
ncbi:MAG: hypothetical protein UZ17_ACD001001658 [Acidobacteria bacterium OLB17]|nr:MAG: hypothetical protein UZ17_ACD001001658 [Acidobacteria bacterium OLB17]MCZ2390749.1 DUF262 domain-containing protein [Acidobacteriota bacterium]